MAGRQLERLMQRELDEIVAKKDEITKIFKDMNGREAALRRSLEELKQTAPAIYNNIDKEPVLRLSAEERLKQAVQFVNSREIDSPFLIGQLRSALGMSRAAGSAKNLIKELERMGLIRVVGTAKPGRGSTHIILAHDPEYPNPSISIVDPEDESEGS
jgi:hypothetical protein